MNGEFTLTDDEEAGMYKAKKLLQLLADLSNPEQRNATRFDIDREALSVFAEVVSDMLPNR